MLVLNISDKTPFRKGTVNIGNICSHLNWSNFFFGGFDGPSDSITFAQKRDQNGYQALRKDRQDAERIYKPFCRFDSLCVASRTSTRFYLILLVPFLSFGGLVSVEYTLFGVLV